MNAVCPLGFLGGETGFGEILLVLAVVLVLFGPRKLPEFARMLGRVLEGLRKASQDFSSQIMRLDEEPPSRLPTRTVTVVEDAADRGIVGGASGLATPSPPEGASDNHESKSTEDRSEREGSLPPAGG
jgi:TatA/E family protein of Tat protein translocase